MSIKKQLFSGIGILAITFGVVLMLALMGRYEATKRSGKEEAQRAYFAEINEAVGEEALERLKRMPVLYRERVQPLDTLARSTIRQFTGRRGVYGADSALVFCAIAFDKEFDWDAIPFFLVNHGVNKERLGLEGGDKLASLPQIIESTDFVDEYNAQRKIWANKSGKPPASISEIFRLANQVSRARMQFADQFKMVPPTMEQRLSEKPDRNDWHLIDNASTAGHKPEDAKRIKNAMADLKKGWLARSGKDIIAAVDEIEASIGVMAPDLVLEPAAIENEIKFNNVKPFTLASWFFAAAAAFAVFGMAFRLKWLRLLGILAAIIGIGLCSWGFYMRITLGFQIAITNLYESMIAVGVLSMLLFLIIDLVR
ncbi:MAG: hypothetical protein ACI97A_000091, partial [Planctomycetota bacterium]